MSISEPMRTLGGAAVGVEVEVDALALAEHPEERALERVGGEANSARSVSRTTMPSPMRVVHADDALHGVDPALAASATLPALRQEVHTWMRFGRAVHDRRGPAGCWGSSAAWCAGASG